MKVSVLKAAALVAAVLAGGAIAQAAEPETTTTADVQTQLKALQEKVSQLEAQQKQANEAALNAVTKDANSRGELMQVSGPDYSFGYDKGLFFQSSDKKFSLKPGILFQLRNATNWREGVKNGDENDIQNGFEIRRLKLYATGNLYSPDLTYGLQLATDSSNNNQTVLDDIYVQYKFAPHYAVKAGQYKGPFNREELISDGGQIAVERSLLNQLLGGGQTGPRDQGVSFIGGLGDDDLTKDPFRYEVMFNDGDGTQNTNYQDTSGTTPDTRPDYGAIGRIDWKLGGDWKDLGKFTAKGDKESLFVLGSGVSVSGNQGNNNYRGTVDALYQNAGGKLSAYGAVIGSVTDFRNTAPGADDQRFDYGALVQLGYIFDGRWEPFVRADFTQQDEDFVTGEDFFPEFTIGANYFFGPDGAYGNRLKLSADLTYLPNGAPVNANGLDELTSGGENEVVLRVQFQFQL